MNPPLKPVKPPKTSLKTSIRTFYQKNLLLIVYRPSFRIVPGQIITKPQPIYKKEKYKLEDYVKKDLMELEELIEEQESDDKTLSCRGLGRKKVLPALLNVTPTPDHLMELKEHLIELGCTLALDYLEHGDLLELIENYETKRRVPECVRKLKDRLINELGCVGNLDDHEYDDLLELLKILERKQRIDINKKKETV